MSYATTWCSKTGCVLGFILPFHLLWHNSILRDKNEESNLLTLTSQMACWQETAMMWGRSKWCCPWMCWTWVEKNEKNSCCPWGKPNILSSVLLAIFVSLAPLIKCIILSFLGHMYYLQIFPCIHQLKNSRLCKQTILIQTKQPQYIGHQSISGVMTGKCNIG